MEALERIAELDAVLLRAGDAQQYASEREERARLVVLHALRLDDIGRLPRTELEQSINALGDTSHVARDVMALVRVACDPRFEAERPRCLETIHQIRDRTRPPLLAHLTSRPCEAWLHERSARFEHPAFALAVLGDADGDAQVRVLPAEPP